MMLMRLMMFLAVVMSLAAPARATIFQPPGAAWYAW